MFNSRFLDRLRYEPSRLCSLVVDGGAMASTFGASGYTIDNSALFDGSTGYLSRTPGSAGNRKTFTIHARFKRVNISSTTNFFGAGAASPSSGNPVCYCQFSGNQLQAGWWDGTNDYPVRSTALYRDTTSHISVTITVDTTQATASNRVKLYANGEQITDLSASSYPPQNTDYPVNDTVLHNIGRAVDGSQYTSDYLSEFVLVDGLALDPTYFGKTDTITPNWIPKAPDVSAYGTNGFYLDFKDAANLGKDVSGNGNDWTVNGTITQSTDTPTNNHATWNPLHKGDSSGVPAFTLSEGNKRVSGSDSNSWITATLGIKPDDTNAYYWEVPINTAGAWYGGLRNASFAQNAQGHFASGFWGWSAGDYLYNEASGTASWSGSTAVATDVVQFFYEDGKLWIGLNNTWLGTGANPSTRTNPALTISTTEILLPTCGLDNPGATDWGGNFAESEWVYAAPTGGKALCTDNLPAVTGKNINDHFKTHLVAHDGTSTNFTLNWDADVYHTMFEIKRRDGATEDWYVIDTMRGLNKHTHYNNISTTEETDANVISVSGTTATLLSTLANANYMVTATKAGLIGSETSGTTDDGKAYSYTANTTLGFNITLVLGSGVAGHNVPHGHGKVPGYFHARNRDRADHHKAYHKSLGATKALYLNQDIAATTNVTHWNDTEPTSSVHTLGVNGSLNALDENIVIYSYAETDLCKIGSYTGNGNADGAFINAMIDPRLFLGKSSSNAANWARFNRARSPHNPMDGFFALDTSGAEFVGGATYPVMDGVAVGMKMRAGTVSNVRLTTNESGYTYAYLMFGQPTGGANIAEAPGR